MKEDTEFSIKWDLKICELRINIYSHKIVICKFGNVNDLKALISDDDDIELINRQGNLLFKLANQTQFQYKTLCESRQLELGVIIINHN